jgi:diphthamide synthase (EF-2-diphthine--ammonia ligase)
MAPNIKREINMENTNWSIESHEVLGLLSCGDDSNTSYLCLTRSGVTVPVCALVEFSNTGKQYMTHVIADLLNKTNTQCPEIPNDLFT